MYKCNFCNREFNELGDLQVHIRRFHKLSIKEIEQYYIDNFKKEGEGIDPYTGNPTEFISLQRGYKKYEKNNPKKLATNTIEHYLNKGLSLEEAQKRVAHTSKRVSETSKEIWKKVKQEGKTRGGWSKKHFIELGFSEDDAEIEMKKRSKSRENKMKEFRKKFFGTDEYKKYSNCCIEFYLNKGLSLEESEILLRERQTTNTLENYIKKYGEEEGIKKFEDRKKKWSKDMEERYQRGEYNRVSNLYNLFSSHVEFDFCKKLISKLEKLGIDINRIFTFNTKQQQYYIHYNGRKYFYDFVYINGNKRKIIEFNGDFWHMNPKKYNENDYNKLMYKFAKEIWEDDKNKKNIAESQQNFEVCYIWEYDWRENEDRELNKCINFLINDEKF